MGTRGLLLTLMARARFALALAVLLVVPNLALAQSYAIVLEHNTNLRSSHSLQAAVVTTAPAGSHLQVIGEFNQWLKISRSPGDVWMAGWVAHSRVDGGAGTSSPRAADIDNCCFVNRQCQTTQEWTDGYWAYQHGQCPAQPQSPASASAQPASAVSAAVDNCCFVDRQCRSDAEWLDGYRAWQAGQCPAPPGPAGNCCDDDWQCRSDADFQAGAAAFQTNQCAAPSIRYQGSPLFVAQFQAAFDLLRTKAPYWYWYAVSGIDIVKQDVSQSANAALLGERGVESHWTDEGILQGLRNTVWLARMLVHEACHIHKWEAGIWFDEGWRNELPCHEVDIQALRLIDRNRYFIDWIEQIIDNYRKYQTWWGAGEWPG